MDAFHDFDEFSALAAEQAAAGLPLDLHELPTDDPWSLRTDDSSVSDASQETLFVDGERRHADSYFKERSECLGALDQRLPPEERPLFGTPRRDATGKVVDVIGDSPKGRKKKQPSQLYFKKIVVTPPDFATIDIITLPTITSADASKLVCVIENPAGVELPWRCYNQGPAKKVLAHASQFDRRTELCKSRLFALDSTEGVIEPGKRALVTIYVRPISTGTFSQRFLIRGGAAWTSFDLKITITDHPAEHSVTTSECDPTVQTHLRALNRVRRRLFSPVHTNGPSLSSRASCNTLTARRASKLFSSNSNIQYVPPTSREDQISAEAGSRSSVFAKAQVAAPPDSGLRRQINQRIIPASRLDTRLPGRSSKIAQGVATTAIREQLETAEELIVASSTGSTNRNVSMASSHVVPKLQQSAKQAIAQKRAAIFKTRSLNSIASKAAVKGALKPLLSTTRETVVAATTKSSIPNATPIVRPIVSNGSITSTAQTVMAAPKDKFTKQSDGITSIADSICRANPRALPDISRDGTSKPLGRISNIPAHGLVRRSSSLRETTSDSTVSKCASPVSPLKSVLDGTQSPSSLTIVRSSRSSYSACMTRAVKNGAVSLAKKKSLNKSSESDGTREASTAAVSASRGVPAVFSAAIANGTSNNKRSVLTSINCANDAANSRLPLGKSIAHSNGAPKPMSSRSSIVVGQTTNEIATLRRLHSVNEFPSEKRFKPHERPTASSKLVRARHGIKENMSAAGSSKSNGVKPNCPAKLSRIRTETVRAYKWR
ncbi:hypothetical protein HDU85_002873 [Gaertneriomyces sp. JEL0708]|nr:hypothetical protein HDU85_002873 [Gaertneriomyces sp. JEL0708]